MRKQCSLSEKAADGRLYDTLGATYTTEGGLLCVGSYNGNVSMYQVHTHYSQHPVTLNSQMASGVALTSAVTCLRMRPQGSGSGASNVMLVTCSDGSVSHWHLGSTKMLAALREEGNQTMCADFSHFGSQFVTVGKDSQVRIYSEERNVLAATLTECSTEGVVAHKAPLQSVRWIGENTIITGGWDRIVQIWDVRAQRAQRYLSGPYLFGDGLDFHPQHGSAGVIVTASHRESEQLEFWDASTFERIRELTWPKEDKRLEREGDAFVPTQLFSAKFSPNGSLLAAGGNHDFRVFKIPTDLVKGQFEIVGELEQGGGAEHAIFNLAWAPNGRDVALTGAGGATHVVAHV